MNNGKSSFWTIGRRVVAGFIAVVVITLVLGAFGCLRLSQIGAICANSTRVTKGSLTGQILIQQIGAEVREIYALTLKHKLTEDPDRAGQILASIKAHLENLNTLADKYEQTITDPKDKALLQAIKDARGPYATASVNVIMSEPGKLKEAVAVVEKELDPAYAKYITSVDAAVEAQQSHADKSGDQIMNAVGTGRRGIFLGLWLAAIATVVVAFFIIRSVGRAMRQITSRLGISSEGVASVAGQMSHSSKSLADNASGQAASLEETAASLEEISSMTKRNAQTAQSTKEFAVQTRQAAEVGARSTREMNSAMEGIKSASEEMRQAMNAIKNASTDVSKIIKTIDEIAFQTNILALNAAVEAARAGEAGMGFAVVADEVRNLAQRSAKAAKETSTMIETAIARSDMGAQVNEKVRLAVEDVVKKSKHVADRLGEIVEKVHQMDEQVAMIATASEEQSHGISQVSTAFNQMDKVTQSNAAGAEQGAAAAQELNAQADELRNAVADLARLVGGRCNHQEAPRYAAENLSGPSVELRKPLPDGSGERAAGRETAPVAHYF